MNIEYSTETLCNCPNSLNEHHIISNEKKRQSSQAEKILFPFPKGRRANRKEEIRLA